MNGKLPSVFEYHDFKSFLKDYQKARQGLDRKFSKSEFSRSLGLPNTRSYLTDVLKGKRVTRAFIERFIHALGLTKDQAQFFRVLVKFNQAENFEERELYFDQLIALNRTPKTVLNKKAYAYYRKWHHSAVRALLNTWDFAGDYRALGAKLLPPITANQARESIVLLKKLNLIAKNGRGFYKPTDGVLSTGSYAKDEIIKQFQLKCIDLAKQAVFKNKDRPQQIITKTLSVSGEGYERIVKKLEKFNSEINSIVHKDEKPADRVYQLDLLFFPQSR